jgi:hypothetical protein
MELEEALRRVYLGRSIAFMGAGFSAGVAAVEGQIPYSFEFAEELSKAASEPPELPLDLAASVYQQSKCLPSLRDLIPRRFTAKSPSEDHSLIASLPWRRIYTTNYDNVVELGRASNRLSHSIATARDHPVHHAHEFTVVHLHGYVGRLTEGDWDEEYVLTNEQYASDLLRDSGWIEMFRNDVQYADSLIFFGYGVGDIDVARLLFANPSLKNKTFFMIGQQAPRSVEIRTSAFGRPFRLDTADVAAMVPPSDDPSVPKPSPFLSALKEISFQPSPTKPSRDDVVELLIKGNAKPEFISRDLVNGTHDYYVSRDELKSRSDEIEKPALRWFVHGGLGEGKSQGLYELAHFFLAGGHRVLSLEGDLDGFANDIDYLSSLSTDDHRRIVVFVEGGISLSNELKGLMERFPIVSFVVTNRSAVLQTRMSNISETLGDDFELIDLSVLTHDEASDFNDILYENGLWGERQGLTRIKRLEIIERRYKGSLASVLLDVCRSTEIFQRVSSLFNGIDGRVDDLKRSIIVSLALAYAGSKVSIGQLSEITQSDVFKFGSVQSDEVVREFFDIERNLITVRSPAFAQAVLKEAVSDSVLIDLLPDVISRLDRLRQDIRNYDEPVKQMMRFGFIERILRDDNQKEGKLVSYFENIRSTGVGISNPQFWLQYAIACMSFQSYKDAGGHFDTAFGLAKNRGGYDPYQIENTYARFLLESRARTSHWNDFLDAFFQAHEILSRQMASVKEGYYPYRVARLYLEFVESRIGTIDRQQKARVKDACGKLIALSEKAPPNVRRSKYWRESREALGAASDFISDSL